LKCIERGKLVRWNDDKGFGFIKPDSTDNKDIFIHISILKHMARKPVAGDPINNFSETQNDEMSKAIKADIEGVAVVSNTKAAPKRTANQSKKPRQPRSFLSELVPLMLVLIAVFGYSKYQQFNQTPALTNQDVEDIPWEESAKPVTPSFRSETGKTHHTHMQACEEAT
jgi:cold shock CspA family protein